MDANCQIYCFLPSIHCIHFCVNWKRNNIDDSSLPCIASNWNSVTRNGSFLWALLYFFSLAQLRMWHFAFDGTETCTPWNHSRCDKAVIVSVKTEFGLDLTFLRILIIQTRKNLKNVVFFLLSTIRVLTFSVEYPMKYVQNMQTSIQSCYDKVVRCSSDKRNDALIERILLVLVNITIWKSSLKKKS